MAHRSGHQCQLGKETQTLCLSVFLRSADETELVEDVLSIDNVDVARQNEMQRSA
jgi:hypothetical protein